MNFKLIITEDNGEITEVEGEAGIFYILKNQGNEIQGIHGVIGSFSLLDFDIARDSLLKLLSKSQTETLLEILQDIKEESNNPFYQARSFNKRFQ